MFHIGINMTKVQYVPYRGENDRCAVCSIEG